MDPATIATLAEQLLTLGLQVYQQVKADGTVQQKPIAQILAEADANFTAVQTAAVAEGATT